MAAGPWARGAGRSDDGGDSGVAVTKRFRRITLKGRWFFFLCLETRRKPLPYGGRRASVQVNSGGFHAHSLTPRFWRYVHVRTQNILHSPLSLLCA